MLPEPRWFGDHADQLQWMRERFDIPFASAAEPQLPPHPVHAREAWKIMVELAAAQPSPTTRATAHERSSDGSSPPPDQGLATTFTPSTDGKTDRECDEGIGRETGEGSKHKRRDRGYDFRR
jgi:hypothetical protein